MWGGQTWGAEWGRPRGQTWGAEGEPFGSSATLHSGSFRRHGPRSGGLPGPPPGCRPACSPLSFRGLPHAASPRPPPGLALRSRAALCCSCGGTGTAAADRPRGGVSALWSRAAAGLTGTEAKLVFQRDPPRTAGGVPSGRRWLGTRRGTGTAGLQECGGVAGARKGAGCLAPAEPGVRVTAVQGGPTTVCRVCAAGGGQAPLHTARPGPARSRR